MPGWREEYSVRLPTRFELQAWSAWPAANVGVVCGGLFHLMGVDIDSDDPAIAAAILGAIPSSPVAKRGAKGRTLFFRGSISKTPSRGTSPAPMAKNIARAI
jgi:hypothetical protein